MSAIYEEVKKFPLNPGVYIMRNANGRIIYVGKAKSLKKRVSQYFLPNVNVKTQALVSHIASIEYIITGSEYESLILENNLIKKNQPRYNIDLKDDKSYLMLKITDEDFPRILKTHRHGKDDGRYFGPFPKGQELDLFYRMLEDNYSFRRCKGELRHRKTPCLYYHISKCSAPCVGNADKEKYNAEINRIVHILEGNYKQTEEEIVRKMHSYAKNLDFENAAWQKNLLDAINRISQSQTVGNLASNESKDYIGVFKQDACIAVQIMQYRNGNLLGSASFHRETFADEEDALFSFLLQYYDSEPELPDRIFVSFDMEKEMLERYFEENFHKKIIIEYPQDSKDFRILKMALFNAENDLSKYLKAVKKEVMDVKESEPVYRGVKSDMEKILQSIPFFGPKRVGKVLEAYSSVDELMADSEEGICSKTGLSRNMVDDLLKHLRF